MTTESPKKTLNRQQFNAAYALGLEHGQRREQMLAELHKSINESKQKAFENLVAPEETHPNGVPPWVAELAARWIDVAKNLKNGEKSEMLLGAANELLREAEGRQ